MPTTARHSGVVALADAINEEVGNLIAHAWHVDQGTVDPTCARCGGGAQGGGG